MSVKVVVSHRGKRHQLRELPPTSLLRDVRAATAAALRADEQRVRLLHRGRQLQHWSAPLSTLKPPLLFLALLQDAERAFSPPAHAAPTFALRAEAPRATRRAGASAADARVGAVEVLERLPDAQVARQMLEQLAQDEGFLYCMRQKGWRVGVLKEMLPDGRVGVDPVCVLGVNVGRGSSIALRLRTDDMNGFRDMYRVRQVYAHELAHCERSEHDDEFKEITSWVLRTADSRSWNVGGRRLDGRSGGFGGGGGEANRLRAVGTQRGDSERLGGSASSSRLLRELEEQQRKRRHQE